MLTNFPSIMKGLQLLLVSLDFEDAIHRMDCYIVWNSDKKVAPIAKERESAN